MLNTGIGLLLGSCLFFSFSATVNGGGCFFSLAFIAGIIGVAILLAPVEGLARIDPLGVILVVGGAMCWAIGSLYARRAPLPGSGLLTTGMEMVGGGLALVLAGVVIGEIGRTNVDAFSLRSLLAFGYLIVFGSIVAFTAYTWLLANVSVSTVGTYAYVNPVVAIFLGWLVLDEVVSATTLVGAAIIVASVALVVRTESPRRR